ncbi:MAG: hypothetical protein V4760_00240 [Bdellovibrionota bacterium]
MTSTSTASRTASELNSEFAELVKDERKLTRTILERIAQFDREKLYAELGYTSVMTWLIEEHGYSKSAAYRRMQAARLLRAVPEARASLEQGKVNITTLSALQTAIRREEMRTRVPVAAERKQELVKRIEYKPSDQAGRVIANEFPELTFEPQEAEEVSAPVEVKVPLLMTQRQIELLETVKGVAPEHAGKSYPELIEFLAQKFVKDIVEATEKPRTLRVARSAAEPKDPALREIAKQVMFPHR